MSGFGIDILREIIGQQDVVLQEVKWITVRQRPAWHATYEHGVKQFQGNSFLPLRI
jgi:hypothetical protein